MVLGEILNKCDAFYNAKEMCFEALDTKCDSDENTQAFINFAFTNIEKYHNYYNSILSTMSDIGVFTENSSDTNLSNIFIMRNILKEKIALIDRIMSGVYYSVNVSTISKLRKDLLDDLIYVEGIINKTVWTTEVNVRS
jgi:hypothetical protein